MGQGPIPARAGPYRCLKRRSLYRYEAVDLSFSADLPVDPDGLVTDYPDMFERVIIAS